MSPHEHYDERSKPKGAVEYTGERAGGMNDTDVARLEEAVREAVPEGEIVTHFDLIVQTRFGSDASDIRTWRISMPGANPHLSYGVLRSQAERLGILLNGARAAAWGS